MLAHFNLIAHVSSEMKEVLTILGAIAGVAFVAFQLASPMLMQRKLKRIASLPTDELKALFGDPKNRIFFGVAAKSLQERDEDLSFAFPAFLDMTLSGNMSLVILGKGCLKTYFPDVVKDIDLDKTLLTKESKATLQELKQNVDELTNA